MENTLATMIAEIDLSSIAKIVAIFAIIRKPLSRDWGDLAMIIIPECSASIV